MILKLCGAGGYLMLLPMLLGMVQNKLRKNEQIRLSETYMWGYLLLFVIFWGGTILPYHHAEVYSLSWMVSKWRMGFCAIGVLCVLYLNRSILIQTKAFVSDVRKSIQKKDRSREILWLVEGVLFILSVCFLVPSMEDDLIERSITLFNNDTLYTTDFEMAEFSFPELFFVCGAGMSGAGMTQLVHLLAPIALLPFFFSVYHYMAGRLFFKDERRQRTFFIVVMLFYFIATFANAPLSVTPLQNIWNGNTMAVSCLLPLALVEVLRMMMWRKSDDKRLRKVIEPAALFVAVSVASELFIPGGAGMCFVIWILGMVLV